MVKPGQVQRSESSQRTELVKSLPVLSYSQVPRVLQQVVGRGALEPRLLRC